MSIEINDTQYNNEPKQVLENQRNIEKYKDIEETCKALKEECIDLRNECIALKNEVTTIKNELITLYQPLADRVTALENKKSYLHKMVIGGIIFMGEQFNNGEGYFDLQIISKDSERYNYQNLNLNGKLIICNDIIIHPEGQSKAKYTLDTNSLVYNPNTNLLSFEYYDNSNYAKYVLKLIILEESIIDNVELLNNIN